MGMQQGFNPDKTWMITQIGLFSASKIDILPDTGTKEIEIAVSVRYTRYRPNNLTGLIYNISFETKWISLHLLYSIWFWHVNSLRPATMYKRVQLCTILSRPRWDIIHWWSVCHKYKCGMVEIMLPWNDGATNEDIPINHLPGMTSKNMDPFDVETNGAQIGI